MFSLNQLKNLYINSPLWVKKLYAAVPYNIRNGTDYNQWVLFLRHETNAEEYELFKMKETITYAYNNTPYYKNLFDDLQVSPYDINTHSDLAKLPYLDKDIVRKHFDDLTVKNLKSKQMFYVTTGGTSGAPMKFLQSKNVWKKELAFVMDFFSRYGYEPSMLKASFRGGEFDKLPKNTYWIYNPIHNEMHFSPFHMNDATIKHYVQDLNKLQPKFFHTYPSSILMLIEHMQNLGLRLEYKMQAIFLISENFSQEDIETIRNFFHCDIGSFYGHSERLIFAPNHDAGLNSYKIDRRYGLFELVNEQGDVITENNARGEMVGTAFDNYAMPLIRYKTNDFTHYVDSAHNIITSIEGRWVQEYLDGEKSFKLYLTALNMHSNIFQNVMKYQFIQTQPGVAELTLKVNKVFSETDRTAILTALEKKAGHAIAFTIRIVDTFQLTARGKFKNIIKTF